MELISRHAKGFVYAFALDDKQQANGLIWMTATMHRNVELYGFFWLLDTMMRVLNSWLWPYIAVLFYNKHKKCVLYNVWRTKGCIHVHDQLCAEQYTTLSSRVSTYFYWGQFLYPEDGERVWLSKCTLFTVLVSSF